MQMLHQLVDNLPLLTGVFLLHRLVNQLENILIEMVYEIVQIFFMSVRRESLSTNPFYLVSLVHALGLFSYQ